MGWACLVAGLAVFVLAVRIAPGRRRGMAQGLAVLIAAFGGLMLLRREGGGFTLPGHGPRRWHQP
jgi:hypothetical protein